MRRARIRMGTVAQARTVLVVAVAASLALVAADLLGDGTALGSLAAVALLAAAVLPLGPRLGVRLPPRLDHDPPLRQYVTSVGLRSLPWLVFALQAAGGLTHLPQLGDVLLGAQAFVLVTAEMRHSPNSQRVRNLRLALDAILAGIAVGLLVWVLFLGPRVGFALHRLDVAVALIVVLLLCIAWAALALLVVREPVTYPTAVIAIEGLLTAVQIAAVIGGTTAAATGATRALPWPLAVCWLLGWLAAVPLLWFNQSKPVKAIGSESEERREVRSTDVATLAVVLAVVLAVAVRGYEGNSGDISSGLTSPVGAFVVILATVVIAVREALLGRLRARATARLRRQANLDPLTGLANRRGLTERLNRIELRSQWSVLALDLDNFKQVNDLHGHASGDEVLVVVADVLREVSPPGGLAARTGGDEFAVLVPGTLDAGNALAHRIVERLRLRLSAMGLAPRITVSVGVGRVETGTTGLGDTPTETRGDRLAALVEAAAALQAAKERGRDRVQVYPGLVARRRERRLLIESRLRTCLEVGGIDTVGQPIVDLTSGAIVAVEALARWQDGNLGVVSPSEFVLVAERAGLVPDLGRSVLTRSLAGFREHGLAGSGVRLAVNVSPLELRHPGYASRLADMLDTYDVRPRELVVEVTEAVLIEDGDPSLEALRALTDLGVGVAIDDFGTGYSALGYLRRLPFSSLKLDRSLLSEARATLRTRQLVSGLVDLAHRLEITVVIEGVEDSFTAELARSLGADHGQGYHLGRPAVWGDVGARLVEDIARGA